jgi:hypothetical protein
MRVPAWSLRAAVCGLVCLVSLSAGRSAAAQTPSRLPAGREVIDRYVKAIGGAEAVRKFKSTHAVGTFEVPAQGLSGTLEVFTAAPDRLLLRVTLPGIGEILNGFDGTVGWMQDPMMGPMLLEGEALAELKFDADYYEPLHDPARFKSIETVEETEFEGTRAYKVRLVDVAGREILEFYAVDSGLFVGSQASRTLPMGTFPVTTVLSDYKEFKGLRIATRSAQRVLGVEQVMTIASIEFDTVDESTFALPPQIKTLLK